MKLSIMQPYFFPYLGYWQMIANVDKFVIYDDVNYIKGGWINRNNLLSNGKKHLFTLALDKPSSFKKINEIYIKSNLENRNKVLSFIKNSYFKAPYYKFVYPLIEEILLFPENNLSLFLLNQFKIIFLYLNIETEILLSSNINKNLLLRGQDKVIDICKKLKATRYINSIGGRSLYNKVDFYNEGICLQFIKMRQIKYMQFKNNFVSDLSIIDVMMFNPVSVIRNLLDEYDLV